MCRGGGDRPSGLEPVLSRESASSLWAGTRIALGSRLLALHLGQQGWSGVGAGCQLFPLGGYFSGEPATCPGRVPRHIRGTHGMPAAPRLEGRCVRSLASSPRASQSR